MTISDDGAFSTSASTEAIVLRIDRTRVNQDRLTLTMHAWKQ